MSALNATPLESGHTYEYSQPCRLLIGLKTQPTDSRRRVNWRLTVIRTGILSAFQQPPIAGRGGCSHKVDQRSRRGDMLRTAVSPSPEATARGQVARRRSRPVVAARTRWGGSLAAKLQATGVSGGDGSGDHCAQVLRMARECGTGARHFRVADRFRPSSCLSSCQSAETGFFAGPWAVLLESRRLIFV